MRKLLNYYIIFTILSLIGIMTYLFNTEITNTNSLVFLLIMSNCVICAMIYGYVHLYDLNNLKTYTFKHSITGHEIDIKAISAYDAEKVLRMSNKFSEYYLDHY